MSELEDARPLRLGSVPQPRTFDFFETLLIVLIAYAAFVVSAQLAIYLVLPGMMDGLSSDQIDDLWKQENWQGVGMIVATPAAVVVLWVAIRKAGRGFAEYLALNWPDLREVMIAAGVMITLFGLEMTFSYLVFGTHGRGAYVYRVAGGAAGLLLTLVAGSIAIPVLEELTIRGFTFRGWSETRLGPIGTILLTSALWCIIHRYGWLGSLHLFLLGLALGYCRWRSNSTCLAAMMHSAFNSALFFVMGPSA